MEKLEKIQKELEQERQRRLQLEKELADLKAHGSAAYDFSSELLYRAVIEAATDIVYKTNAEGYFVYVNPAAVKVVGYSEEELLTMHFSKLIAPEFFEKVSQFYLDQFRHRTASTYYEYPIVTKHGKIVWLGQNVQLYMRGDGWIEGFSAFARDISERVRSEEQLKILNLRFSSIINNIHSGILLESVDRKIIIANDTLCRMFHAPVKPEQVIGDSCPDIFKSMKWMFKDGEQVLAQMEECVQRKEKKLNVEIAMSDGRIFERDFIPVILNDAYTGHLWKYRDITEQKKTEHALIQSEEKYRRIIQNMNLGLLVVDNNERIVDVNPSFCEMTGYTQEEIIGWSARDVLAITEESRQTIRDAVELRRKGISNAYEIQVTGKSGKLVWMMISGSPIYDEEGKLSGSIGIHLDITERKLQEERLREAHLKAERSAHSKEVFLANMSHEIRTPMNAVLGMARLLENAQLNKKERGYLEAIKISSENLLVIINDILDFSKIDQGKLQLEETTFSFSDMIKSAMIQFEFKFMEKNLAFYRKIDPAIGDVFRGDPTRLSQVLTNLISNSVKFTEEGNVSLSCCLQEDTPEYQKIRFTVSDTGVGIAKEKLLDIFESFMQADSSISRKYGGTGLGLSISRQLVKLFGGELTVESEKGKGSSFSFEIQLKKGQSTDIQKEDASPPDYNSLKGLSVLLVEDNKLNQFVATALLDQFGAKTSLASNGQEAVSILADKQFDVVLMDLQMPVMGGLEATRIIREELKSKVPIIALTANAIKGDSEKCIAAGMNDYISKPFTNIELAQKMLRFTGHTVTVTASDPEPMPLRDFDDPGKTPEVQYDLSRLLDGLESSEEFARNMVDLFIETAEETIVDLEEAYQKQDYKVISALAHKIKPSLDLFNIKALTGLVRILEKPGEGQELNGEFITNFVSLLRLVIKKMKADQQR